LTEAIGKRLPMVALPFINAAQAEHPAFQGSIDRLRAAGVRLLYGPDVLELHEPGTGSQRVGLFPCRPRPPTAGNQSSHERAMWARDPVGHTCCNLAATSHPHP
jgi:hypothetical protein